MALDIVIVVLFSFLAIFVAVGVMGDEVKKTGNVGTAEKAKRF